MRKWIPIKDPILYCEEYKHKSLNISIHRYSSSDSYGISMFGDCIVGHRSLKSAKRFAINFYKRKANERIKELKNDLRKL